MVIGDTLQWVSA